MGVGAGSLGGVIAKLFNAQFLALFGLLISVLIVLTVTYLSVRRFRPRMSLDAFRHLYVHSLIRTAGWAVGSYLVWFILIASILSHLGVKL
ncbi:MAG: hypothetical protein NVSMB27_27540 [Ktedonobacteraceae bacterium]